METSYIWLYLQYSETDLHLCHYLKYIARDFHRSLGNLEIESESSHTSSNILNDTSVGLLPLAEDLAGAKTWSAEQRVEGKDRVDSFIEFHKGKEVLVFTDGSVEEGSTGMEGVQCAAVLLPISPEEHEKIANVVCTAVD